MAPLWITGNEAADALLTDDPNALLIGMVLDQQIPMEKAFAGPYVLAERMSGFSVDAIANTDLDAFVGIVATKPAVHRFPSSMGKRVHDACTHVVEDYDGDVQRLYDGVDSGAELLSALRGVPGFGDQKAAIFLALLGKQRGVTPTGWREAAGEYGAEGVFKSVADVRDAESLAQVRAYKKAVKAAAKAAKQA